MQKAKKGIEKQTKSVQNCCTGDRDGRGGLGIENIQKAAKCIENQTKSRQNCCTGDRNGRGGGGW